MAEKAPLSSAGQPAVIFSIGPLYQLPRNHNRSRRKRRSVGSGILCMFTFIWSMLFGSCFSISTASIHETVRIKTADTELYAEISGDDTNAPVLLYLHGGPANPFGFLTFLAYSGPQLEERFVVVYLQQRGIMRSDDVPENAHALEDYVSDVHYVVQYLKGRFVGRDIFLFGHSWGGLLAYLYLIEHEGDIQKLVTACAPLDVRGIMATRFEETLKWARESHNEEAIKDLSELTESGVSEDRKDFEILGKWSSVANGGIMRNISPQRINDATEDEKMIGTWLKESRIIGDIMFETLMNIDITGKVVELRTPLLAIAGEDDIDSPWRELKRSGKKYGGESTFLLLKNSHHLVYVDQEEKFVEAVVSFLSDEGPENTE